MLFYFSLCATSFCSDLIITLSLSHASGNNGLGKSTLVNTLFKSQVSRRSAGWTRDEKIPKTVEVKAVSHGELLLFYEYI